MRARTIKVLKYAEELFFSLGNQARCLTGEEIIREVEHSLLTSSISPLPSPPALLSLLPPSSPLPTQKNIQAEKKRRKF